MLANSSVHDRIMLSLSSQHEDLLPGGPTMPPLPIAVTSARDSLSNVPEMSPGRLNLSLQLLESQSHAIRLSIQAKEQGDKETPKTYARQYSAYESWWNALQQGPAPSRHSSDANHSFEGRNRKPGTNGETIPGSSVGKATISPHRPQYEPHRISVSSPIDISDDEVDMDGWSSGPSQMPALDLFPGLRPLTPYPERRSEFDYPGALNSDIMHHG
ncbi:hypothetical protein B0H11DRAFT_1918370 [Mycena galericulata]|nr:hypothetical protein B0H11DRAFT_1918370 [Mycena galericulata]